MPCPLDTASPIVACPGRGPDCTCYVSTTGDAICGSNGLILGIGCATNDDCLQQYGADLPFCILSACGAPEGQACGPGLPACAMSQACLNGQCRETSCAQACR